MGIGKQVTLIKPSAGLTLATGLHMVHMVTRNPWVSEHVQGEESLAAAEARADSGGMTVVTHGLHSVCEERQHSRALKQLSPNQITSRN